MVSSKELQNLGIDDSDHNLAQILSDQPRRSSRASKPISPPGLGEPTTQKPTEITFSSTSSLSAPPSDFEAELNYVKPKSTPPSKRRRKTTQKGQVDAPPASLIVKLRIGVQATRRPTPTSPSVENTEIYDNDDADVDVDTEMDDVEDEPEYLPSPQLPRRSSQQTPRRSSRRASKTKTNSSPKAPFLVRNLEYSISTPPNGLHHEHEAAAVTRQDHAQSAQLATPSSISRQTSHTSEQETASPPQTLPDVDQPAPIPGPAANLPQFSRQELQICAGLDDVNGQKLEKQSRELMKMSKKNPKPKPQGISPVWADSRQILCETLPYYRSHHGAAYACNGVAFSFMFDAQADKRDFMDSTVVISRAGGGMKKDEGTGMMVQHKDTAETHIVKAFRNGVKFQQPVCIIVGDRNPTAQFEAPHKYCVLDWFKPAQTWAEKSGDRRVIRYRFEVLDSEKPAWWKGKDIVEPVQLGELPPPFSFHCSSCKQSSQQIYLNGWVCTNYECSALWKYIDGKDPKDEDLEYDPRWLKQHTPWKNTSPPQQTRPDPWVLQDGPRNPDHDTVWQATKGIVCPKCNRCGERDQWTYWECKNCETRHELPRSIVSPALLRNWYNPVGTGFAYTQDVFDDSIQVKVMFKANYRVHVCTIPGIDGCVIHMIANKTVNEEADGPDDMFLEMQSVDIGLKRASMKTGEGGLTNQFSKNFGMPYKFIAAPESSSLEDAPKAIQSARARMNWAARAMLNEQGETFEKEFNEVLALGYMQGNQINYHDDGEKGLGPTIATLSLGYPAKMKLRMKQKHFKGCTERRFIDRPPLPGCLRYEERLAAYRDLQVYDKNSSEYRRRLSELPSDLKLHDKTRYDAGVKKDVRTKLEADPVITLNLRHGGIVIMHGAAIQEYYEHAVFPEGKLRFALTSRHIDIDSLKEDEKPEWGVSNEKEPYDGFKLPAPGK